MRRNEEVCVVQGTGRVATTGRAVAERVADFAEADAGFSLEQAMAEAQRCTAATPCTFCDVCQLLCPDLAITRDAETRRIVIDLDYCKGCGLCAHYCPHDAIRMVVDE